MRQNCGWRDAQPTPFHTTHGCTARLRWALALGSRQEVAVARVRMIKPEEADADTLLTARDDDAAFAAMKQHFSEKQIVELTVFCGMWNYSNRLCEALHVDLERPDKRIEFQHT